MLPYSVCLFVCFLKTCQLGMTVCHKVCSSMLGRFDLMSHFIDERLTCLGVRITPMSRLCLVLRRSGEEKSWTGNSWRTGQCVGFGSDWRCFCFIWRGTSRSSVRPGEVTVRVRKDLLDNALPLFPS